MTKRKQEVIDSLCQIIDPRRNFFELHIKYTRVLTVMKESRTLLSHREMRIMNLLCDVDNDMSREPDLQISKIWALSPLCVVKIYNMPWAQFILKRKYRSLVQSVMRYREYADQWAHSVWLYKLGTLLGLIWIWSKTHYFCLCKAILMWHGLTVNLIKLCNVTWAKNEPKQ